MDEIHQQILQEHWSTLKEKLEPLSVLKYLTERGVLNQFDQQNIENKVEPLLMSEELLQILCGKENEPNAFDEFLNALEKVALEKEQPCLSCLLRRADMDNSRDKQHSSMATTSTAKGRRARCSVNEAAIRLPEIKTVQRRDGKRRETPYKRTFSYKRDFDKKGGVIYYLGKIPHRVGVGTIQLAPPWPLDAQ
ncbi:hypothetical protein OS493_011438 [Desmophyllum pertusum]|uniref:CARD domain-containing protein n=1 Tax=Desmophyllum pertusum TaxID=174260 RepID=A0A9X0CLC7_9CNID|nr:hypothetical protein OS493_011438 [Desmophyllum pertusum]